MDVRDSSDVTTERHVTVAARQQMRKSFQKRTGLYARVVVATPGKKHALDTQSTLVHHQSPNRT